MINKSPLFYPMKFYCIRNNNIFLFQLVFSITSARPFGLTLYNDKIYWTDWLSKKILVADKKDGFHQETLQSNIGSVMDIAVFHRNRLNSKYCI